MATRCEGWTRHGGAFTLGPVQWKQCENEAVVLLTVEQDGKVFPIQSEQPACMDCWKEAIRTGITITSAAPLENAQEEER